MADSAKGAEQMISVSRGKDKQQARALIKNKHSRIWLKCDAKIDAEFLIDTITLTPCFVAILSMLNYTDVERVYL